MREAPGRHPSSSIAVNFISTLHIICQCSSHALTHSLRITMLQSSKHTEQSRGRIIANTDIAAVLTFIELHDITKITLSFYYQVHWEM